MFYCKICKNSNHTNRVYFELNQDLKPKEEQASLESEVKKIVHKAFWDLLEEQLKEDPPNFQQAISLLTEIKEGILGLLVPQQKRLIESINGYGFCYFT